MKDRFCVFTLHGLKLQVKMSQSHSVINNSAEY